MDVDIHSLGRFNRLSRRGAERAASALSQLSGLETVVDVTRLNVTTVGDLGEDVRGDEFVGVRIGYTGGLEGSSVLLFDREDARTLLDGVVPESWGRSGDGIERSAIAEVGNIMLGGFVNGWADQRGEAIHLSPPDYVEGRAREVIPPDPPAWTENGTVLSISSELESVGEVVEFRIYMFPDSDSFERLVDAEGEGTDPVPLDRLGVFARMTEYGAEQASGKITSMTGIETSVRVSQLSFVPIEEISRRVPDREVMAVVLQFDGPPSGYLAIVFDEVSARHLAERMVPDDGGFGEMHRSAIREIGNLMTSGFVDGWANALGSTTEISPPELVNDDGPAIVNALAARLGRDQEYAFVHDSSIVTPDEEINCDLYALPDEAELRRALDRLAIDDADGITESALRMTREYDDL
jgi:chemotaxis protein CheY-P-specific phosphatase CheC